MTPEEQLKLEARAARFGLQTAPKGVTTQRINKNEAINASTKPINPADAEKLAARAARFADVNKSTIPSANAKDGVVSTNTPMRTTLSSANAEILAKRAARFSGIQ